MKTFLENWLKRVEGSDQKQYGAKEITTMINAAIERAPSDDALADSVSQQSCRHTVKVENMRRGDVFIHKLVGGKLRPWIVLEVEETSVVAIAMSSSDCIPNAMKSECRLWAGSWITPTITNVSIELASKEVTRPYTNARHLAEVEKTITDRFSPKRIQSIAEILERRKAREAA